MPIKKNSSNSSEKYVECKAFSLLIYIFIAIYDVNF